MLRALLALHICHRVLSTNNNCVYGADAVFGARPNGPEARWTCSNTQCALLAATEVAAREYGWPLAATVPELDCLFQWAVFLSYNWLRSSRGS